MLQCAWGVYIYVRTAGWVKRENARSRPSFLRISPLSVCIDLIPLTLAWRVCAFKVRTARLSMRANALTSLSTYAYAYSYCYRAEICSCVACRISYSARRAFAGELHSGRPTPESVEHVPPCWRRPTPNMLVCLGYFRPRYVTVRLSVHVFLGWVTSLSSERNAGPRNYKPNESTNTPVWR